GLYDSLFGKPAADMQKAKYPRPPAQSALALPNSAYLGTYKNNYAGSAKVYEKNNSLILQLGPANKKLPLKHYNGNVFLSYPFAETPDVPFAVSFKTGSNGKTTQVEVEMISDAGGDGTLMRATVP
ncbi:MAG: DUF3471 domain-containing protein, partial [Rubrobacteridae bacterium]|nr:DUF3471 domain-containing protein [Rubrobacteridae bacterium]